MGRPSVLLEPTAQARAERAEGRSVARSGAGSAPGGAERSRVLITTRQVRAWRTACLARTGEPTAVKAYQIMRAILNTAVDDELIRRNPCRIKGADRYDVPERPTLTVAEVFAVADAIAPRYRLLVLLGRVHRTALR